MWLKVANLRKTSKDSSPKAPLIWYFVAGREVVGELPIFHRGRSDKSVSNEFLLRFFCKIFRFHFGRTNYFLGTSLKTVKLPRNHQWCSLPLVQAPSPQGHLGWLQWLGADVWWLSLVQVHSKDSKKSPTYPWNIPQTLLYIPLYEGNPFILFFWDTWHRFQGVCWKFS